MVPADLRKEGSTYDLTLAIGVLEVLRQPIEDSEVTIFRAKFTVTYPVHGVV